MEEQSAAEAGMERDDEIEERRKSEQRRETEEWIILMERQRRAKEWAAMTERQIAQIEDLVAVVQAEIERMEETEEKKQIKSIVSSPITITGLASH